MSSVVRRNAAGTHWYTVGVGVVVLAARRVWRVVGPPLRVVSATGWIVLGVAIASFAVGRILGWLEFVYLGITLAAGFVMAFAFIYGRAAYEVEIELTPRRVSAGERALGRLLVRNARKRRSSASRLELPVGAGVAEFGIPALVPGDEHEELFAVPTNRRAVIVAGPAVSVRGDQLGMLRRAVRWADPIELFVHPITTPLAPSAAGLVRDLEGEVTKTITNSDISFHALRAYEPGDDRRYVHWRTSARTGQLMVRQFEETRRSQVALLFASDSSYFESEDEFELSVSVLASIGIQIVRDGTTANVLSDTQTLRTLSMNTLLDDSCRLTATSNVFPSAREFARVRTSRIDAPSVVIVVSGSLFPMSDFRAIKSLFGSDAQTIGFRAELDAAPRLSAVSGLRVATVGRLSELAAMLRRMS